MPSSFLLSGLTMSNLRTPGIESLSITNLKGSLFVHAWILCFPGGIEGSLIEF
jgi:hypothetical protein